MSIRTLWLLSLLVCCLAGCAVDQGKVYEKDGKKYGVTPEMTWRGRWWDYYQRGTSYSGGEYWQDAIADFQAAIRQRENDQRRARTYGLHFLNYFPHRELGIVYYRLKRYPEAIAELKSSLRTVDSAKTKFYLNRARKALLEQSGRDSAPPRIVFAKPEDDLVTNRFTIQVSGQAEDDTYVSGISINGRELFIELALPRIAFDEEIRLENGENSIEVVARDLIGRSFRQKINVHVDRQGPLVGLDRVEVLGKPAQQRARVRGFISDRSRIKRFLIGRSSVPIQPLNEWEFDREVPFTTDMTSLPFEVEDTAGNITLGQIQLPHTTKESPQIGQGTLMTPLWPLLTYLPSMVTASDRPAFPSAVLHASQQTFQTPPTIKLTGIKDKQTVYVKRIYLGGMVIDDSAVSGFYIGPESVMHREAQQIFFGRFVDLDPGKNEFKFVAKDKEGHLTRKEIIITYVIPEIEQPSSRLQVALLPFKRMGKRSLLGESVYDFFLTSLIKLERFQMVERSRLAEVMNEQKLSQTVLVDDSTAIQIGKIVKAEGMLMGSIIDSPPQFTVSARFVDVESTALLFGDDIDVYGEDLSIGDVKKLMQGLAWKCKRSFPIVAGQIKEIDGKTITIRLDNNEGIKKNMKFMIFREGKNNQSILGEARLDQVGGSNSDSKAEFKKFDTADMPRISDKVITK
jgi:TolB-like protein